MDLPHNPTSPEKNYEEVSSKVTNLWHYIQKQDIPGLKLNYGGRSNAMVHGTLFGGFQNHTVIAMKKTNYGKHVLKESTIIVKNDFGLEALKLFILNEKSWIENFSND